MSVIMFYEVLTLKNMVFFNIKYNCEQVTSREGAYLTLSGNVESKISLQQNDIFKDKVEIHSFLAL